MKNSKPNWPEPLLVDPYLPKTSVERCVYDYGYAIGWNAAIEACEAALKGAKLIPLDKELLADALDEADNKCKGIGIRNYQVELIFKKFGIDKGPKLSLYKKTVYDWLSFEYFPKFLITHGGIEVDHLADAFVDKFGGTEQPKLDEKEIRIKYQDIVYKICLLFDTPNAKCGIWEVVDKVKELKFGAEQREQT